MKYIIYEIPRPILALRKPDAQNLMRALEELKSAITTLRNSSYWFK